jgi:hypothetical protein
MLCLAAGVLAVCLFHVIKPSWPGAVAMWPLTMRLTGAAILLVVQILILKMVVSRRSILSALFGLLGLMAYVFIEGVAIALTWSLLYARRGVDQILLYAWPGAVNLLFSIPDILLFTAMLVSVLIASRYYGRGAPG